MVVQIKPGAQTHNIHMQGDKEIVMIMKQKKKKENIGTWYLLAVL